MTDNPFVQYAGAGLSPIPIRRDGSKAPLTTWQPFQTRIADAPTLADWERRRAGIGIVAGRVSGGLEVIDIDEPDLVRPFIDAVKAQNPDLLGKLTFVETPRTNGAGKHGAHVYYRCTACEGNQKLAQTEPRPQFDDDGKPVIDPVTGKQRLSPAVLIETRANGGYVLTVGCPAECHPTGNLYRHVAGPSLLHIETIPADERQTLLDAARSFDRFAASTYREPSSTGPTEAQDRPGDAFAAATPWADILSPHGWTFVRTINGRDHWRRPGKAHGWSATTGNTSTAGADLLCCFSANAHPFQGAAGASPCTAYSKFAAFALLNCGGDFAAAARDLASRGFGRPAIPRPGATAKPDRDEQTRPAAAQEAAPPVQFQTLHQACRDQITRMEGPEQDLIALGLPGVDDAIGGGVARGEMVIFGARTSHGKTMAALQCVDSFADRGLPCLLISEEMAATTLAKRAMQHIMGGDPLHEAGSAAELRAHVERHYAHRAPVFIPVRPCGTVSRAVQTIAAACCDHGVQVVVVDYAQLLRGTGRSRYEQITDVSTRLREQANKHNVVMLILAQLNRDVEKRTKQTPRLWDLRDTGQLEQDADVVLLFEHPIKSDPTYKHPREFRIHVGKNRNRAIVENLVTCEFHMAAQMLLPARVEDHPNYYDELHDWR